MMKGRWEEAIDPITITREPHWGWAGLQSRQR